MRNHILQGPSTNCEMSSEALYIGCHMSLISKQSIRYDGVLYSVDANEVMIALSNGRSLYLHYVRSAPSKAWPLSK